MIVNLFGDECEMQSTQPNNNSSNEQEMKSLQNNFMQPTCSGDNTTS